MKNVGGDDHVTFDQLFDYVIDKTHAERNEMNAVILDKQFEHCVKILGNPYLSLHSCFVAIMQILGGDTNDKSKVDQ